MDSGDMVNKMCVDENADMLWKIKNKLNRMSCFLSSQKRTCSSLIASIILEKDALHFT